MTPIEKALIPIYPEIGHDSLKKLMYIAALLHPEWAKKGNKSGEQLNQTLSYCIEITYNTLEKSRANLPIYDALPPPKTIKAQKLYDIYQLITTMKAKGYPTPKIQSFLNDHHLPTPDDICRLMPLTLIKDTPSDWGEADLNCLFADNGQPSELLREYLRELNKRSQRKRKLVPPAAVNR